MMRARRSAMRAASSEFGQAQCRLQLLIIVYSYKLHGTSRPISMKSDVIRKCSRHDAHRGSQSGKHSSEMPSASRNGNPNASPQMERSHTLAPDSTTQMSYNFSEDSDFRTSSELIRALGNSSSSKNFHLFNSFLGPYHQDYISQQAVTPADALPFASADIDSDAKDEELRTSKRRRMSTDFASEPPSSAVSFSSYNDGYSSQSSTTSHSQQSLMDFPFNNYSSYNILRGSGNTFWHPPMVAAQDSPQFIHPPMLSAEDAPWTTSTHPCYLKRRKTCSTSTSILLCCLRMSPTRAWPVRYTPTFRCSKMTFQILGQGRLSSMIPQSITSELGVSESFILEGCEWTVCHTHFLGFLSIIPPRGPNNLHGFPLRPPQHTSIQHNTLHPLIGHSECIPGIFFKFNIEPIHLTIRQRTMSHLNVSA